MDRREFLTYSATGMAGLCLAGTPLSAMATTGKKKTKEYSVVMLGDTHFDTEPDTVYHSLYNEPVQWLNDVQRKEFARNGEMWRDRCPRLVKRAACLIDDDTRMVLQMGDLIQGDCGNGDVHRKMLDDVMNGFKADFGGLPFVTVVGNHDIRGVDAEAVYHSYMPQRMSQELGKEIGKTTFSFNIGPDAFLVLDFNKPDDAEIEKLLKETKGARHTFVMTHGPLFPYDGTSCRWFFHGGDTPSDTEARRHFRMEFAKRDVICLCGHTHYTEFADWRGDGGRITQMTMSSVWGKEKEGIFRPDAESPEIYGTLRESPKKKESPDYTNETVLFEEYRPGLQTYLHTRTAGCYKLIVKGKKVWIDFYAGDSTFLTRRFEIR